MTNELSNKMSGKIDELFEEIETEDLNDLIDNLWTTSSAKYAELRNTMKRHGVKPEVVKVELASHYFLDSLLKKQDISDDCKQSELNDITRALSYRISSMINRNVDEEAGDKFDLRDDRPRRF